MKNKLTSRYYWLGSLVVLITIFTSYLVYTNPNLNMAALFNAVVPKDDSAVVYMPGYEADAGEQGVIEIKTKGNIKLFDSLSFVMNYDPVDALSFDPEAILFDNQTVFQNATVKKSVLKAPGSLEVTMILNAPLSVEGVIASDMATHKTLFKLNTKVSEALQADQIVKVNFKDFAVSNGNQILNLSAIPDASITLKAKNELSELDKASVTSVLPASISNKSEVTVTLTGKNLTPIKKVWLGKETTTILNQSDTSISIKVPAGLALGVYDVVLFDQADKSVSFNDFLTINNLDNQEGEQTSPDSPKINIDRSYTNPSAAVNDGKTPLTLYTFVEDDDLKSVIVNLSNIGQVGAENGGVLGQEKDEDLKTITCPHDSNVIVCMKPSIEEGKGQWFILNNVTVSKAAQPSATAYEVPILALDQKGNSETKMLPVYVGEEQSAAVLKALVAVSTSETTLELLFNKKVDPTTILSSGAGFSISTLGDEKETLAITKASLDDSGKIVTLTTAEQLPETKYSLSVSTDIQDTFGKSVAENANNKLSFGGFIALNKAPVLDYVSTLDNNLVELEFQQNLKLSTILGQKMKIYEADHPEKELKISGVKLLTSNLIQVQTDPQIPGRRYRVEIEGLTSYDGTPSPVSTNKGFKGYNGSLIHAAATSKMADLDNDGRVDFSDFTIFSSVYGTVYSEV